MNWAFYQSWGVGPLLRCSSDWSRRRTKLCERRKSLPGMPCKEYHECDLLPRLWVRYSGRNCRAMEWRTQDLISHRHLMRSLGSTLPSRVGYAQMICACKVAQEHWTLHYQWISSVSRFWGYGGNSIWSFGPSVLLPLNPSLGWDSNRRDNIVTRKVVVNRRTFRNDSSLLVRTRWQKARRHFCSDLTHRTPNASERFWSV